MKSLADLVPHWLFVISKTFCGTWFVLLIAPLLMYIVNGKYSLTQQLHSFPALWGRFFSSLSFASITVVGALLFMFGMFLAEFGYMVCWRLHYHNDLNIITDLNIQGLKRDASEDERKRCDEEKAWIFEHGILHRLWEWENFQTSAFLYAEYNLLLFAPLYTLCLVVSMTSKNDSSTTDTISATVLAWTFAALAFVFLLMTRKVREKKYEAFARVHQALVQRAKAIEEQSRRHAEKTDATAATSDEAEIRT
ncbi:MAG: hypothetical protein ABSC08_06500 [Bryobacteraceae bacterium]|jgi:hypothetical protein